MRQARTNPTPQVRRGLVECRRTNADALGTIVRRHGWPTADLVGAPASTAALMILLHAPDLDFQLRCRDLIALATADGRCPGPHHAYIADHCAVELGQPQFYGTRVDPATLRPYPIDGPRPSRSGAATSASAPSTSRCGRCAAAPENVMCSTHGNVLATAGTRVLAARLDRRSRRAKTLATVRSAHLTPR